MEASRSEKSVEETLSVQNHEEAYHSEKAVEETSSVKNRKKNISIWVTESSKTVLFYFVILSLLTNVQNKTSLSVGALKHSLSLTHSNSFIHSACSLYFY